MSEQSTQLRDEDTYKQLAKEATTLDEIVTLREMAAADSTGTDTTEIGLTNGEGAPIEVVDVTTIGKDELATIHAENAKKLLGSMAVHSKDWHTEEK